MPKEKRKKQTAEGGDILKLCQLIGIDNFKDLQTFKREEKEKGETVAEALKRYLAELQKEGFVLKKGGIFN